MSYLHPSGEPDKPEEVLEQVRVFVRALAILLRDNEGIIIELKYQPKYPKDPFGKYLVFNDAKTKQLKTKKISPDDSLNGYDHGQFVWVN